MNPDEARSQLGKALRRLVQSEGLRPAQLSRELGLGGDYLSRAFSGRYHLRLELTLRLLERLNVVAFDFFDSVFPFGGSTVEELAALPTPPEPPGEPPFRTWLRAQHIENRPRAVAEVVRRAGLLLRQAITDRGLKQKALSEGLGLGPVALGLALRGNTQLTFFHIFGVLAAVDLSPARFFVDLFATDELSPTERLRRRGLLDWQERVLGETTRALLTRNRDGARPAAGTTSPAAGEAPAEPRANGKPR